MFIKFNSSWNVTIPAKDMYTNSLMLQRAIIIHLLDAFATKKATKDLGYLITPTTVESIGEGKIIEQTGEIRFPVVFKGISFKILEGEILHGVVYNLHKLGVFLRTGPYEIIYLSHMKMSGYKFIHGETPMFMNQNMSQIQIGVKVRFVVIKPEWEEEKENFRVLASIDEDYLGPI